VKIIFLTRSMVSGGAERQLSVLATGLQHRGHDVIVAEFYAGGALETALRTGGVRVVDLQKSGRWNNLTFFLRLLRLIYRERPDIVHGYHIVPDILTLLLRWFSPSIKAVLGVRSADLDLSRYDWTGRFCYRLECLLAQRTDLVIANSQAGRAFAVKNGFPAEKLQVIPNGIDTDTFQPDRQAGLVIRRGWSLPDDVPLIGFVGRIDPMKDPVTFLKAAQLVCAEQPKVRFVCVGRSEAVDLERMKRLTAELGIEAAVTWAGEHNDLTAVYNSLDILCLSSKTESFPNVVCEAMACGTPCVVTDVGDAKQIVWTTGRVVAPQDPAALAEGLLAMLAEKRIRPDQRTRQRIVEHFSVERLLDATEAALESLRKTGDR
jgi:glycosyltransferase involved in cell wall biosynthesis